MTLLSHVTGPKSFKMSLIKLKEIDGLRFKGGEVFEIGSAVVQAGLEFSM